MILRVATVLVLILTGIAGVFTNARVYRYFYPLPAELAYGLIAEGICVGYVITVSVDSGIQVQPGRLVCTTGKGEHVHESVYIRIITHPGASIYGRVLKLHVNTTHPLLMEVVVEYPVRDLNATIILSRGREHVAVLQLSTIKTRLAIYVEPGVTEYGISFKIMCYKPGLYNFRVGLYIAHV